MFALVYTDNERNPLPMKIALTTVSTNVAGVYRRFLCTSNSHFTIDKRLKI